MQTENIVLLENSGTNTGIGELIVYNINNIFTNKKLYTEFCFAPQQMFWNYFGYNEWLKLINMILCTVTKKQPVGARGTYTKIELDILNKRIIEPDEKIIGAENIFNYNNQYVHGKIEIINNITSENGFIALDARFTLYDNLGNAQFKILRM